MSDQETEVDMEPRDDWTSWTSEDDREFESDFDLQQLDKALSIIFEKQEQDRKLEESTVSLEDVGYKLLAMQENVKQDQETHKKHIPTSHYISLQEEIIDEEEDTCSKVAQNMQDAITNIRSLEVDTIPWKDFREVRDLYEDWKKAKRLRDEATAGLPH